MNEHQTLKLFIKISQQRMHKHYLPKLIQSVRALDTDSLWLKESDILNSAGGIVLHICEHVRRNSIRFSNLHPVEFGKGIEDHFPDFNLSPEELCQVAIEAFDEFHAVLDRLLEQTPEEIDMHSLYHLVEHTGYHLGQVVDRAKRMTQTSFQFCQNGINERNLRTAIEDR